MAAVFFGFAGMLWLHVDDEARRSRPRQRHWRRWILASAAAGAKRLTIVGGVFLVLWIYKLFGG